MPLDYSESAARVRSVRRQLPPARIYLAGPIAGLNYEDSTGWREECTLELARFGMAALSPMRAKEYLAAHVSIGTGGYPQALSTGKGIVSRDRQDCTTSDMVFMNLLGATRISLGSCVELGWADLARVPVVLIIEADGSNPHEHAFLDTIPAFRVDNLEDAVAVAAGHFSV